MTAPFYADQLIATFDTLRKVWILATVVCVLPKNSCQVHIYYHTRCHLWEHIVKCNNTVPEVPSASSDQAYTRFPWPVSQPTITAQHAPQSVAPVTPEPKPAVPVSIPAIPPKITPVPTPTSTQSVASVQPQRSGHAHTAPKCLITEMLLKSWLPLALQMMYLTQNTHGLH